MERLIYYIMNETGDIVPFLQYEAVDVGVDELYARQLCTYFIYDGQQYELYSNEMEGAVDVIVLKRLGENELGEKEERFHKRGIHLEFRKPSANYPLLARIGCDTHYDVLRFLLKHVIDVPGFGSMLVSSSEIDEDRGVYVLYVTELDAS